MTIRRVDSPDVVIRDQMPMNDKALKKCLQDGLNPEDWYRLLNQRIFFWLSRERLRGLLGARAYRNRQQTVLTLDTRSIVELNKARIELCPINSGSTLYNPVKRGKETFLPIEEYDYDAWLKKRRSVAKAIVEFVVRDGIPDIIDHVIAVHNWANGTFTQIWRRPGANLTINP